MKTVSVASKRRFSLLGVETARLVDEADLSVELLCFEAGQGIGEQSYDGTSIYQVLEGEAVIRDDTDRERCGPGRVTTVPAGTPHTVSNAGGGLLVVVRTTAR